MPSGTGQTGAGVLKTFFAARMLWIGIGLVLISFGPLLLAGLVDPDGNAVGPGLLLMCCGKPALGVLLLGVVEGVYLVIERRRKPPK